MQARVSHRLVMQIDSRLRLSLVYRQPNINTTIDRTIARSLVYILSILPIQSIVSAQNRANLSNQCNSIDATENIVVSKYQTHLIRLTTKNWQAFWLLLGSQLFHYSSELY